MKAELAVNDGLLIQGDHRRLAQVFSNLIVNAIQAMPRGGSLSVRADKEASEVRITFTDTGSGFSPAALDHFAEFFYSEKEGGMGIGLSVAHEIIKAHGGRLSAGNLSSGACVTVVLPV